MIMVNTDFIPGKKIAKALGMVRGNTIRVRHIGKDITAGLRTLIGGEVPEYTKMMAESREQSLDRMMDEAKEMGADAVINVRFSTSEIMKGAAEILAYGTAVLTKDE